MKFIDKYTKEDTPLGHGTVSKIFRCKSKESGEVYAVKVYDKARLSERRLSLVREEARVGLSLPVQPNLVRVLDTFEDAETVMIVMEYMPYGTLYQHQSAFGAIPPMRAGQMLRQILQGLAALHSVGVMHRDIKPENIFFRSKPNSKSPFKDEILAIGDYGFATRVIPDAQCVGSPQYCAPEVALIALQGLHSTHRQPLYNEKCDLWAVGVVAFVMLTGLLPFDGSTPTEVFTEVIKNLIPFHRSRCPNVNVEAKQFILKLTNSNPSKRPSAKEVLRDAWIIQYA